MHCLISRRNLCATLSTSGRHGDSDKGIYSFEFFEILMITIRITYHQIWLDYCILHRTFPMPHFHTSNTMGLWSIVSQSLSNESLGKFVYSLSCIICKCSNQHESLFQVCEFPIFYATITPLHLNQMCCVHNILCFMPWKYSWTPFSM